MSEFDAYTVSRNGVVRYVGITTKGVANRWKQHQRRTGHETALGRAIKRFGPSAFTVDHVACAYSEASLLELETVLIAQFGTMSPLGYNLTSGGRRRLVMSGETKARMRVSHTGWCHTLERRKKSVRPIRGAAKPMR